MKHFKVDIIGVREDVRPDASAIRSSIETLFRERNPDAQLITEIRDGAVCGASENSAPYINVHARDLADAEHMAELIHQKLKLRTGSMLMGRSFID